MSKKVKKVKVSKAEQQKKQERKANLFLALKTLISNDACIQVSREWKGFKGHGVPIIIAFLSVTLALIPSLVTRLNVDAGNAFLGSPNFSYDTCLNQFTQKAHDEGVHINIVNGEIVVEGDTSNVFSYPSTEEEIKAENSPTMTWYHVTTNSGEKEKTVFEVFLNNKAGLDDVTFFTNITPNTVDNISKTPDGKNRVTTLNWSYLAIGKKSMIFARYNPTTGVINTLINGQYDTLEGYKLIDQDYPTDKTGVEFDAALTNKWKTIISRSYESQKIVSTWQYVGVLDAVYSGLIILFGGLIWVMTRGKNNPLRVYTFWQTQRMSYWASFAPAVLSIAAGFFLQTSSLGMFAFIFIFGMRLMWMSMKALRPVQQ